MAYAPASLIKGAPDWHEIVNANFTAIAAALANKANKGMLIENPPLQSGWVYHQVFVNQKSYFFRLDGFVIGQLSISNNTEVSSYQNVLTIPEGFRPRNKIYLDAHEYESSTRYSFAAYSGAGALQNNSVIPANKIIIIDFFWLV
jgi:hypothetical protein